MSIEALNLALSAAINDPPDKAVLLGLANHAGPDGRNAYPSVLRLQIYSGLSERTIRRSLGSLAALGLISTACRAGGRNSPSNYTLDMRRLAALRDPRLVALEERVPDRPPLPAAGTTLPGANPARQSRKGAPQSGKGAPLAPEPSLTIPQPKERGGKNAATPPPPTIAIFRKVAQVYPKKSLWPMIMRRVGSGPADLDRWHKVIEEWIARGYKPINIDGILDVFERGWTRSNGSKPKSARPGLGYDPVADVAAFRARRGAPKRQEAG